MTKKKITFTNLEKNDLDCVNFDVEDDSKRENLGEDG